MSTIPARLRARAHHLAAALLLLACYASLASVAIAPWRTCQVDEPGWISSSYRTFRLYAELASPSRWRAEFEQANSAAFLELYPPIGKLIVGALVAIYREPGDPVDYAWKWPGSYESNLAAGNLPPTSLLRPVRLGIVGLSVLTLALVYIAAIQVTGTRWLALLAPAILFLSPIFRMHATQVYMEAPQVFLLAASVVAFNDHLLRRRRTSFALALVLMGLACAVKLNSAPIVLACGLFVVARPASLATRLRRGLAAACVPVAVFCAVNPYLYDDPLAKMGAFVSGWSEIKGRQQLDPQLAAKAVPSRATGLALMARETIARPTLDHRRLRGLAGHGWILAMGAAVVTAVALRRYRFEVRGLASPYGRYALGVLAALGIGLLCLGAVGLPALLLALGFFGSLAMRTPAERAAPGLEPALFVATCAGVMLVATGLWIPHDWARYYLPTLVLLPAFYVAGFQFVVDVAAAGMPRAST